MDAIQVEGLRKIYTARMGRQRIAAVDGIDLTVKKGELFGLLGPNGAGKTTTVKMLLGLTIPTEGRAHLLGLPVSDPESRRRVGYLPEGHRFPGYLTARQTLSIFARMSDVPRRIADARIPELLARVKLAEWADVRVKKFSKGMTQRLGLAAALVHEPDVLLLDEPTDGVDPVGRREIRDLLRAEAAQGKTVLLNSHLLSEIELTCDRVAVLRRGKVAAAGSIAELTRRREGAVYRLVASGVDERLKAALERAGASVGAMNGHLELGARDVAHVNDLLDLVRAHGSLVSELTPLRSTLEDVFVELVKTEDASPEESTPEVVH
jgi:ABC-2 type transport system ATP-binding protein